MRAPPDALVTVAMEFTVILHLSAVRSARLRILADAEVPGSDAACAELVGDPAPGPDAAASGGSSWHEAEVAVDANIAKRQAEFMRIDAYERKVSSRRAVLVRRLDYLLLEV